MLTRTQTELHRHLDVSVRLSTLHELLTVQGQIQQSESLEAFRSRIELLSPMTSLSSVLNSFELFRKIWTRPEIFRRIAREIVIDCAREGTTHLELRYSPTFVDCGVDWAEALAELQNGIREAQVELHQLGQAIQVGLICIASRESGFDSVGRTLEFYLRHWKQFVAADLAGNEDLITNSELETLFQPIKQFFKAKNRAAPLTIHAGESTGPDSIWFALDTLGAQRIGHGIAAAQDPQLMRRLITQKVCLEICPTSNWLIGVIPQFKKHPLKQLVLQGVPVSINTDDPTVFATTLPQELLRVAQWLELSPAQIQSCETNAQAALFEMPHG